MLIIRWRRDETLERGPLPDLKIILKQKKKICDHSDRVECLAMETVLGFRRTFLHSNRPVLLE